MDEQNEQFPTCDVLILLAVLVNTFSGGIDIRGIIAFVDYVDHNVLEEDELVGGLHRLSGFGFITVHDGLFRAPLRFAKEFGRRAEKVKAYGKKADIAKALMEENRAGLKSSIPVSTDDIVNPAEYHRARNDYLAGGKKKK